MIILAITKNLIKSLRLLPTFFETQNLKEFDDNNEEIDYKELYNQFSQKLIHYTKLDNLNGIQLKIIEQVIFF